MKDWVYSEMVKRHFLEPQNALFGDESSFAYDSKGVVGNVICGDQMSMMIKVSDDVITDVRWKTYGCASAIAATSMLSCVVKGMKLADAYHITPEEVAEKLGGLPKHKFHCSVLGDQALKEAINQYLEKTGRKRWDGE